MSNFRQKCKMKFSDERFVSRFGKVESMCELEYKR
jgi:hypothetical protein